VKIAVIGGTGELGSSVVRELVNRGIYVRLLVRNSAHASAFAHNCELIVGDVCDDQALRTALRGCDAVHVSLRAGPDASSFEAIEHGGTARVARIAGEESLGRISYLSGMLVDSGRADHLPEQQAKAAAERAVRNSGRAWTIFRPTYFMETLSRHVVSPRSAIVIGRRLPPLHMVAAEDFARMVATALTAEGDYTGTYFVRGPRAITLGSALERYCAQFHPEARVKTMSTQFMRIVDKIFMGGRLRPQIDLMSVLEESGEIGDTTETERVFGSPRIDFDEWLTARHNATPKTVKP
jgi:uncharacterized protein YbjT (DUF2867 family)